MVLGLTDLTSGSITCDGTDVASLGARGLRTYYASVQGVFQDPFSSYNPVFRVDRVFTMIRRPFLPGLSDSEWKERLRGSLEAVSLEPADVLGKYPHQLSGGQLQRLLIARALMLELRFLVADEIISMLDASTRIDVLNLLGDLKARGLGVLFVTHDLALGNYISDRTVILRRGRVVEMGATQKVFGSPAHPYTRMLLTSVPHLSEKWGGTTVETPAPPDNAADGPLRPIDDDHFVAT
jgi:peptide/nickel transport system ATP-binding protein